MGTSSGAIPSLVDARTAVDITVFATATERDPAMAAGTRRLLRLSVPSPVKAVEKGLDPRTRLVLGANPDGSLAALLDDCADAAVDVLTPKPAWTKDEFSALRDRVATELVDDHPRHRGQGRQGAHRAA